MNGDSPESPPPSSPDVPSLSRPDTSRTVGGPGKIHEIAVADVGGSSEHSTPKHQGSNDYSL